MELTAEAAATRFAAARVARLATVDASGQPHLVPVSFAAYGDTVAIAVDHKPKSSTQLKRLRNIEANNRVSVLADHYDDVDWTTLWWVRADGTARIIEDAERAEPLRQLTAKYPQYTQHPPTGPVTLIHIQTWRGWAYTD